MLALKHAYWFHELDKDSGSLAGVKGALISDMANNGFPVPEGFVVGADSFRSFLAQHGIDHFISQKLAILDVQDSSALQEASDLIKARILEAPLSSELRVEITRAYNRLCGVDLLPSASQEAFVAVRSSPTSFDAAFAGLHAAFLNCKGAEDVLRKLKGCWASLYDARVIYQRASSSIPHEHSACAVIVQKMVQADVSGTMMTSDPQTQGSIVIEACFGLGEAVSSGLVVPDRFVVDKAELNIIEAQQHDQETMIARVGDHNEAVEVPAEKRSQRKLSDEHVLALSRFALALERHYVVPQIAEWAMDSNGLFLVQTRFLSPLTTEEGGIQDAQKDSIASTPSVEGSMGMFGATEQSPATSVVGAVGGAMDMFSQPPLAPPGSQPSLPSIGGLVTGTKVFVNIADLDRVEELARGNVDGAGYLSGERMLASLGDSAETLVSLRPQEFVDAIAEGLRRACAAFYPRPVVYRAIAFSEGSKVDGFKLEMQALERVCDQYSLKNMWLALSVDGSVRELRTFNHFVEQAGLHELNLGIACDIPALVLLVEEFAKEELDFFTISLEALSSGLSGKVAIDDPALFKSIDLVASACRARNVRVGVSSQAWTTDLAEKLVSAGMDWVSVNPEAMDVARRNLASAEQQFLLTQARKKA